jgi:predicted alpha/beta-fold hydrolase
MLHGLNGSSDAHYMKGIATKAFARGMNVVRLNQRTNGDRASGHRLFPPATADAARRSGACERRRPPGRRGVVIRSAATWR